MIKRSYARTRYRDGTRSAGRVPSRYRVRSKYKPWTNTDWLLSPQLASQLFSLYGAYLSLEQNSFLLLQGIIGADKIDEKGEKKSTIVISNIAYTEFQIKRKRIEFAEFGW